MNLITPPKAGKARAPASFGERGGLRGLHLGPMCPSLPDHEVKTKGSWKNGSLLIWSGQPLSHGQPEHNRTHSMPTALWPWVLELLILLGWGQSHGAGQAWQPPASTPHE